MFTTEELCEMCYAFGVNKVETDGVITNNRVITQGYYLVLVNLLRNYFFLVLLLFSRFRLQQLLLQ